MFADISLPLFPVVPFELLGVIRQTHTMALTQSYLPINLCYYSWRAKPPPSLADRLHSCFAPPKSRLFDVYLYFFSLHFQTHSIFSLFLCSRTCLHVLFSANLTICKSGQEMNKGLDPALQKLTREETEAQRGRVTCSSSHSG